MTSAQESRNKRTLYKYISNPYVDENLRNSMATRASSRLVYSDDGKVYHRRSNGKLNWRGEFWYVLIDRVGNFRTKNHVVRRDKLNNIKKLEVLRWNLLEHLHMRLLPRYRAACARIRQADSPKYISDGRLVCLKCGSDGTIGKSWKTPTSPMEQFAFTPISGDENWECGTEWSVINHSISEYYYKIAMIDYVLLFAFDLYLCKSGHKMKDKTVFRFIVNSRTYSINSRTYAFLREDTSVWPSPSDIEIRID